MMHMPGRAPVTGESRGRGLQAICQLPLCVPLWPVQLEPPVSSALARPAQPQAALRSPWSRVPALGLESGQLAVPRPRRMCQASDGFCWAPSLRSDWWLVPGPHHILAAPGRAGNLSLLLRFLAALHACGPNGLGTVSLAPAQDCAQTAGSHTIHTLPDGTLSYSSPDPKEGMVSTLDGT